MLPRRFRSSAPWAPAVRVGLPPIIVPALGNRTSHIVTPMAPTGDHRGTSYPQIVRISSDGAPAWGMTLTTQMTLTTHAGAVTDTWHITEHRPRYPAPVPWLFHGPP